MSSLKIIGGRLADTNAETTVLVRNGRIAALGEAAGKEPADHDFDATGCLLTPGFVDLCCNLREPGNGQKGNIASESLAAAHRKKQLEAESLETEQMESDFNAKA